MRADNTERKREPAVDNYCLWLDKVPILSERVDGRWRHRPVTGGPAWDAYLATVETRTTAS